MKCAKKVISGMMIASVASAHFDYDPGCQCGALLDDIADKIDGILAKALNPCDNPVPTYGGGYRQLVTNVDVVNIVWPLTQNDADTVEKCKQACTNAGTDCDIALWKDTTPKCKHAKLKCFKHARNPKTIGAANDWFMKL